MSGETIEMSVDNIKQDMDKFRANLESYVNIVWCKVDDELFRNAANQILSNAINLIDVVKDMMDSDPNRTKYTVPEYAFDFELCMYMVHDLVGERSCKTLVSAWLLTYWLS